jgi:hypothetical protein
MQQALKLLGLADQLLRVHGSMHVMSECSCKLKRGNPIGHLLIPNQG